MKLKEVSYSKLRQYLFCPRAFRFSYIDRIRPQSLTPLRVGEALHRAVEVLVKKGKEAGEVAGIKKIYSLLSDPVEVGNALLMFNRVCKLMENHSYLRSELTLRTRIDGLPPILSRFDVVQPTKDFYRVIDLKTSYRIPARGELEKNFQARFYKLVADHHVKEHPVKFAFYFVRYDTLEDVDVEPISEKELRALIDLIEGDDTYQPKPHRCHLCPYLYHCGAGKESDTPESVAKAYLLHKAKYQQARDRLKEVTKDSPLQLADFWFGYSSSQTHRMGNWRRIAQRILDEKALVKPDLRWMRENVPDFFKKLAEENLVKTRTQTRFGVRQKNKKEENYGEKK